MLRCFGIHQANIIPYPLFLEYDTYYLEGQYKLYSPH
ncbi:hypothetical protein F945_02190 [Acinetobacter rudis CIP 110305]|uniref:Uncharacterized protein n=1 Tax=Acinetobacter rudis CIP 110305 TaxID=421052 RepID=S3NCU3_9GAMM|nr:hypothetical protein F945_02190 [Acinetobacter rudis CIP 110305]